jgi:hypothetical protein
LRRLNDRYRRAPLSYGFAFRWIRNSQEDFYLFERNLVSGLVWRAIVYGCGPVARPEKRHRRLWVEMTRRRAAAYGHRAFNAGFPAMNPIGRPSQPDPQMTYGGMLGTGHCMRGLNCLRAARFPHRLGRLIESYSRRVSTLPPSKGFREEERFSSRFVDSLSGRLAVECASLPGLNHRVRCLGSLARGRHWQPICPGYPSLPGGHR